MTGRQATFFKFDMALVFAMLARFAGAFNSKRFTPMQKCDRCDSTLIERQRYSRSGVR